MPITPDNPFKGRQYPGDVILMAVRWYLRYPLAYEHVAELLAERGLAVDRSCVWRWVQVYGPELNQRCRPYLKSTKKSYRVDETFHEMPGDCQAVFSCAVTNLVRLRHFLSILSGPVLLLSVLLIRRLSVVVVSSLAQSPL